MGFQSQRETPRGKNSHPCKYTKKNTVLKVGDPMLPMRQNTTNEVQKFRMVQPGMELQCSYRINTKKESNEEISKSIVFTGPVIQKTRHLFAVRDARTSFVHCLSLPDCICGHGKYKIKNT